MGEPVGQQVEKGSSGETGCDAIGTMSEKNPPKKRSKCGTMAGYQQHYRMSEEPCQACREANAEYKRKWKKKQKKMEQSTDPASRKRGTLRGSKKAARELGKSDAAKPAPQGYPAYLRAPGRRMWDELREQYDFDPASELLLVEACRLKDRLERFAAALASQNALWFELGNVEERLDGQQQIQVVVNGMISEARQTQAALAVTLSRLGVATKGEKRKSGPSIADELQRKRQERLAAVREGA